MKKVVLINQNSGYLTIDIANAFTAKYDEVILMAGFIKPMQRELSPKVKTQKIARYDRTSNFKRIYTWLYGSLQIFFLVLSKYRKFEIIYFTNPPMGYLFSVILKNKFSLVIYDTYPDALKTIGIKENNIIFKIWVKLNKRVFKNATKLITLSDGMAALLSKYTEKEKIKAIPNWAGSDNFAPLLKENNPFVKEHGLENRFIVLYSGNMGYTHNVETIIEVAKLLRENNGVHFLMIGDGQKKEKLIQLTKEYQVKNITFLTWQPATVLPYSLASSDLSVITLNDETSNLSVPSKTYNLLATGSPILCIAPKTSELAKLIDTYSNGMCFENKDIIEMANYIKLVAADPILKNKLSENSLNASKDFSKSNAFLYV